MKAYAFIDPGSSTSLISEEVRLRLKAQGPIRPLTLAWTNGHYQVEDQSVSIALKIKGTNGRLLDIKNVRSVRELNLPK